MVAENLGHNTHTIHKLLSKRRCEGLRFLNGIQEVGGSIPLVYCQTTADRAETLVYWTETAEWRVGEKSLVAGSVDTATRADTPWLSRT